jgi:lytic murein transglycosylase
VLALLDKQPEFTLAPWDYLSALVSARRVAEGRASLQRWRAPLQAIAQSSGVPATVITAVWGVESNFGQNTGKRPLLQSLATLSCFGRRQDYFRDELAAALRIVQEGHIAPEKLRGSWAGAFGQTQFMPSTFLRSAVDFDGDGRRDIVDSVPDALASAARFLQNANWRRDVPWGVEVRLPPGMDTAEANWRDKQPVSHWRLAGVTLAGGAALPDSLGERAGLLLPARDWGDGGPAFLVTPNFDALYSYNASENYALAIAHLSDLLSSPATPPLVFATPWPAATGEPPLSRTENRQLQTLLLARGHAIGQADGIIGAQTRAAIRSEQRRLGMPATGRASPELLRALSSPS